MKQQNFEHEIFIRSDVASVMQAITDMSRSHLMHPLIIQVDEIPPAADVLKSYRVTDSLKWGPFKFKIKYQVDFMEIGADCARMTALPASWMKIESLMTVTPRDGGVVVKEAYVMQAPALVFGYSFDQAKTSHQVSLQNMKRYLENKKS